MKKILLSLFILGLLVTRVYAVTDSAFTYTKIQNFKTTSTANILWSSILLQPVGVVNIPSVNVLSLPTLSNVTTVGTVSSITAGTVTQNEGNRLINATATAAQKGTMVSANNAATTLVAASSSRLGLRIQNLDADTVFLYFAANTTVTSANYTTICSYSLVQNGVFSMAATDRYTGEISGFTAGDAATVNVISW